MMVALSVENMETREIILNYISDFNFDIEITKTVIESRDWFGSCGKVKPDILIIDLSLLVNGKTAGMVNFTDVMPDTKVILLSNIETLESIKAALESGAFRYLKKPVKKEELLEAVKLAIKYLKDKFKREKQMIMLQSGLKKMRQHILLEERGDLKENYSYLGTVESAQLYIEENYHTDISLESISERFFINKNYFSEIFKRETGKSFVNYLNEVRIEKTRQLLIKMPELKTTELARMVGFNEDSYFIRVFKKYNKCTPMEYKKAMLVNQ
jgi:two-component system response regulator YesN